ncbi:MAG TPA: class II aldolase/adducin family protein [Thermoleophilaceae bacterium]
MSEALPETVVATAREMLRLGLVSGTQGNVSARDGEVVLITPAGMPYEDMSADDVVAIDSSGEPLDGRGVPSSEWRVHLAIYAARPDVGAIVHTHSERATAWSHLDEPLGTVLTARVAPTGTDEIAAAAVEALGDLGAVLLGRHGVLAVAATPEEALTRCVAVEREAVAAWRTRG